MVSRLEALEAFTALVASTATHPEDWCHTCQKWLKSDITQQEPRPTCPQCKEPLSRIHTLTRLQNQAVELVGYI